MGTELDAATQRQLDRGQRLVEILKQNQYVPMDVAEQVSIIFAGTEGLCDKVPVAKMKDFEIKFLKHMRDSHSNLLNEIKSTGVLKGDKELREIIIKFVQDYVASL